MENEGTKLELENCNYIKAILMLFVVLQHSMAIYSGVWGPLEPMHNSLVFNKLSSIISSFHIYGFVLVSGYIFYFKKFELKGYENYTSFVVNKAKRLLIPYVFVSLVWVIPLNLYFFPEESVFEKFVLGISPRQLWFCLMLFWVFVIFWPLSKIMSEKPFIGLGIVLFTYGIGILLPSYFCFDRGLQYLLYFYIGFIIRKSPKIRDLLYSVPVPAYIFFLLLTYFLNMFLSENSGTLFRLVTICSSVIMHIVGAVGIFIVLQRVSNHLHDFLRNNKLISFFAKHSFTIYLFHQQIIYFCLMFTNGMIMPAGVVFVNFVVSIIISALISIMLSKNRGTSILVGNKYLIKNK